MHLVDHDGVVAAQQRITGQLCKQHTIGQHAQSRGFITAIIEAHLTSHHRAKRHP